jgi:ribosome biogenesis GTP-binding protein YsxC/EngB
MLRWNNWEFIMGIVNEKSFDHLHLPQIIFIGRSNVGKSSLINALVNNRNAALVSNTPGKTREINVFNIDKKIHLMDCPGYGYAAVSKSQRSSWIQLIEKYFQRNMNNSLDIINTPAKIHACVLIDAKVGVKNSDRDIIDMLVSYDVEFSVVLTKADKARKDAMQTIVNDLLSSPDSQNLNDEDYENHSNYEGELNANADSEILNTSTDNSDSAIRVIATSATKSEGISQLRHLIFEILFSK